MEKRKIGKKAVSPIISTVLLIMIVIILAIIILLWAMSFLKEAITKEVGPANKRVNEFCGEIDMYPVINADGTFTFENKGQIPIYAFNLKLEETGTGKSETVKIDQSVNPGFTTSIPGYNTNDYEAIKIIPILLGKTKEGASKEFTCPSRYGLVIK